MTEQERDKKKDFEEAALPHMQSLYYSALRMTQSSQGAEDLVQDTYLRAYKSFDSFQMGTNCKAWLFTISRNLFINKYRKDARSPKTVPYEQIEDFYLYDKVTSNRDLSVDLLREPERLGELIGDEVNDALGDLPDEFREVVILSDIEGFAYEEISKIIDSPVGTVKSRLYRARRCLQKSLWDYAKERRLVKE